MRRPRALLVALLCLLVFAALPAQANPRVQGGLMLVGGCSEAFAGGTIALGTGETVVGVAGGLYMLSAGVDTCSTGAVTPWPGEHHLQAGERVLVNMGMSENHAQLLVAGADLGVDVGMAVRSLVSRYSRARSAVDVTGRGLSRGAELRASYGEISRAELHLSPAKTPSGAIRGTKPRNDSPGSSN